MIFVIGCNRKYEMLVWGRIKIIDNSFNQGVNCPVISVIWSEFR